MRPLSRFTGGRISCSKLSPTFVMESSSQRKIGAVRWWRLFICMILTSLGSQHTTWGSTISTRKASHASGYIERALPWCFMTLATIRIRWPSSGAALSISRRRSTWMSEQQINQVRNLPLIIKALEIPKFIDNNTEELIPDMSLQATIRNLLVISPRDIYGNIVYGIPSLKFKAELFDGLNKVTGKVCLGNISSLRRISIQRCFEEVWNLPNANQHDQRRVAQNYLRRRPHIGVSFHHTHHSRAMYGEFLNIFLQIASVRAAT